ncbi:MAG: UDP-N-acetylmuramoyl-L-alanyl-D-glutamate--2,6-diaminopimelate ligase [Pseudomonadota bacterium]
MLIKDLFPQYSGSNLEISALEIDSRLVKKGAIFFALQGHNLDGKKFIDSAFANGAVAVVVPLAALPTARLADQNKKGHQANEISSPLFKGESGCTNDRECRARGIHKIFVDDVYQTLIQSLQKFYPDLPENILAVTGTNGKTSVAYFIQQMQEIIGLKAASIGTIGIKTSDSSIQKELTSFALTTPDIVSLYKNLAILKQRGVNDIAIEASSIGLQQKRLAGLKIGLGAFTNFTQDHLDYHGSMEKYFECKMLLFKETICDNGIAVLNADIAEFEKMKEIATKKNLQIFAYSAKNDTPFILKNINLQGDFQKANLLCALLCVISYYKLNQQQIELLKNNLDKIKPAEGRMQLATTLKNGAQIFIDYAHTPDALQNVLTTAKKMIHNNLYILFGCGGDRDKSKRPQMGKIASNLADFVIITDDNPRTENAAEIRKEILVACDLSKTIQIDNRKKAIEETILKLSQNDILIIAGKGHEKYQIIGSEKLEFDEEKIVNDFLNLEPNKIRL